MAYAAVGRRDDDGAAGSQPTGFDYRHATRRDQQARPVQAATRFVLLIRRIRGAAFDIGDGRETQRVKTIERCQEQVDRLERQRVDIDATLAELNEFISLLKGEERN